LLIAAALAAESPEPAVLQLLAEQQAAWNRGDLEGYMAGYWRSPELTFLSGTTVTRGWDETLARYRKRYQEGGREMGKLDFSELHVEALSADAALARGRWHLAFESGKGAGGVFTVLVRKVAEGFRVVHDHSSGEADPPRPLHAAGGALQLRGELPRPGALALGELQQVGAVQARFTEHGQAHEVRGVPLDKVLASRGFAPGKMGKSVAPAEKRPGYKLAAIAGAADGFQAVFTLAELSEAMGGTRALVVWEMDGQPLAADRGPLRLVVTTDREPSRSVYQLESIEVVDVRKALGK
jgi:beta-aspartyl-peptidase (threonine type)